MKKKITFLLAVLILAGAFAMMVFTANAATDSTADTAASSAVTSSTTDTTTANPNICDNLGRKQRLQLTDAQKAEMNANREAMKAKMDAQIAKWNALTDAQKAEATGIQDQIAALQKQLADKYLEFGVIDSDTATQMKSDIDTRNSEMKADGRMPMAGGGKGHRGGRGCPPPIAGETK